MTVAAVKRYWTRLVADGCLLCGAPAEIAHCHGGSMTARIGVKAKGKKLSRLDWCVLPLCPAHHRDTSEFGLDRDVSRWEAEHGTQESHLNLLCRHHGLDLWALSAPTKPSPDWVPP